MYNIYYMSDIQRIIRKPLSDADLKHILGEDLKIIKYSELSSYSSLESLLPKTKDYCIILYEEEPDSGHWVALLRYGLVVEFFDPYGKKWDTELTWIPKAKRQELGETQRYLSGLMERSTLKRIYSPYHFEKESNTVNTCGSHCAHRIYRLQKEDMDLTDYYSYMEEAEEKVHASPDEVVAEFVESFGI